MATQPTLFDDLPAAELPPAKPVAAVTCSGCDAPVRGGEYCRACLAEMAAKAKARGYDMTWFGNLPVGTAFKTVLYADTVWKKRDGRTAVSLPGERTFGGREINWDPLILVYVTPGTPVGTAVGPETTMEQAKAMLEGGAA